MGLTVDISTLQISPTSIINHSHFRELIYTSRTFNSNEAQQIGLISVIDTAISLVNLIACKSPITVQGSKISLNYARNYTVDDNFNFTCTWNSSMVLGENILKSIMASSISKEKK